MLLLKPLLLLLLLPLLPLLVLLLLPLPPLLLLLLLLLIPPPPMHGDGPLRFTLGRRPPSGVVAMPLETFPRRPPAWSPTARRFSLWVPSSSGSARDYTRYHYPDHRPRDAPRPSNTSLTLSLLLSLDVIRDISGRISLLSPSLFHSSRLPPLGYRVYTLATLIFSSPHLLLSLILTRVAGTRNPIYLSPLFTDDTH